VNPDLYDIYDFLPAVRLPILILNTPPSPLDERERGDDREHALDTRGVGRGFYDLNLSLANAASPKRCFLNAALIAALFAMVRVGVRTSTSQVCIQATRTVVGSP
jgi:hypothetical protein